MEMVFVIRISSKENTYLYVEDDETVSERTGLHPQTVGFRSRTAAARFLTSLGLVGTEYVLARVAVKRDGDSVKQVR